MYLEERSDRNEPMSTTDDDVKDATAALKGMLGIGEKVSSTTSQEPANDRRSKSNSRSKKGKGKQNSPKRNQKNSTPNENRSGSNSKGGKKKKENKPPKPENFAWSAFQTSPDASALPIPAFVSPANSLKLVNDTASQLNPEKLTSLLTGIAQEQTSGPPPIEIMNAPRAEDLEAKVIAEAEKAAQLAKAAEVASSTEEAKTDLPKEDTKQPEPTVDERPESESKSGINLAALAASPSAPKSLPPSQNPTPINNLPPTTPFSSPTQYSSPAPYHSPPPHQQHRNPYAPPSPGYVTIQVQVPPGLMADRRMVVASPAGYPVQIVVPEGVHPGMIIPVHVPAGPIMQSPYGGAGGYPPQQMPYDMRRHQYGHHPHK